MLKILLVVFRTQYCLNIWMGLVDTLPAVKYNLEFKVTDLLCLSFMVKDIQVYIS